MAFKFEKFLKNELVKKQLELFSKKLKLPKKPDNIDLIQHIENCYNDPNIEISSEMMDELIKNSVKFGERRNLYITQFKKHDFKKLSDYKEISRILRNKFGIKSTNFNKLNNPETNTLAENEYDEPYIEYLEIKKVKQFVKSIQICFATFSKKTDEEGISFDYKSYIWVEFLLSEGIICFRIPSFSEVYGEPVTSNRLFNDYFHLIQSSFGFNSEDMTSYKEILYEIAKSIFEVSEMPFKERFESASSTIERISKLIKRNNIFSQNSSYELFNGRMIDLFERVIIQENFIEYMSHSEGKDGIITKLEFTDPTGALVRANAGTKKDDTLELCDIFFDTRKTLSEESTLEQLLIEWFIPREISNTSRVVCKFFVSSRYLAINFQRIFLSQEVEEYVFSKLKKYDGFEWYKSY